MPGRERAVDRGSRSGVTAVRAVGQEIRDARLGLGLSQQFVADATAIAQSRLSRIERGLVPTVGVIELARLLAVLGRDLSMKVYPGGNALRDSAHLELVGRLTRRVPAGVRWRTEVAIEGSTDRRAWDLVIYLRPPVGVEAENRVRDLQDLERRVALKKRDSGMGRVILLLRDTRWNRGILAAHRDRLRRSFPITSATALAAIEAGRDPGGDAIVLL